VKQYIKAFATFWKLWLLSMCILLNKIMEKH